MNQEKKNPTKNYRVRQQKTFYPKANERDRQWVYMDATDKVVGRLATQIAMVLRGKHKATYTPGVDGGDFVVVTHTDQLVVTGNKKTDKHYYRHSGYPGGLTATSYRDQMAKDSRKVLYHAVKGMLPHNSYGRALIRKLKLYSTGEHPHAAQKPETLSWITKEAS